MTVFNNKADCTIWSQCEKFCNRSLSIRLCLLMLVSDDSRIPLMRDVSSTTGVSITRVTLSSVLRSHWHVLVTDAALSDSSKTFLPTIWFAAELFLFPVLPSKVIVRGSPAGSFRKGVHQQEAFVRGSPAGSFRKGFTSRKLS